MEIVKFIEEFGFPIVAAVGLLYMIYWIWSFVTEEIKTKLTATNITLIGLIDRIRMLDNDIIRLRSKLDTILEMREHEREHCDFFENEIKKRKIKPTRFLPLWDLLGVGLGFGTTLLGKKAAMLCTASVEEVIDKHYQDQINQLGEDEKELRDKIIKFREDELHHKDIAYEEGASKTGIYSILDKIIKTGSKIAINISEKI